MPQLPGRTLHFGLFEVDPSAGEVRREGVPLRIQEKPFLLLLALLERPGDVVQRDELKARLWPAGTHVEFDEGLNAAIAKLRQALGDTADNPRFIQTLPRRGYRFLAPVSIDGIPTAIAAGREARSRRGAWLGLAVGLALTALAVIAWRTLGNRGQAARLANIVPLAVSASFEHRPSWSPDGSSVAYASDQLGNMDVWKRVLAEEEAKPLTADHEGFDGAPAWSPDGRWIAFASDHEGGGIDVVPVNGGPRRRLAAFPFVPSPGMRGSVPALAWSPDGEWLALAHGVEGRTGIYLLPAEGGRPRPVPTSVAAQSFSLVEPSWSPDGRRLAFAALTGALRNVSRIWTIGREGGAPVALTAGDSLDVHPVWSADGARIFFISDRGGTADVWTVPVDGDGRPRGRPSPISAGVGVGSFAMAPDGRRIAYTKTWERSNIWQIPAGRPPLAWSDARAVTAENHVLESLDASREGGLLVFDSNRSGNSDIWGLHPGGELRPITRGPEDEWHPSLSPDARRVAFHALHGANREICVAALDGGAPACLTQDPAKDWLPRWSPDGDWIVFNSDRNGDQDVFVVPSGGGEPRVVARHPANDHNPAWSPDGRSILFASNRAGPDELYLASREGGAARRLTSQGWEDVVPLLWPGEETLYVWARKAGKSPTFWVVDPRQGSAVPLFGPVGRPLQLGVALASDGRSLYFPVWERLSDIWLADLQ